MKFSSSLVKAVLGATVLAVPILAQHASVEVGKHSTAIPKSCELVVPASIPPSGAGEIDLPALVKEAFCKGSGDMLSEYTYVTNSSQRQKDKKGTTKEQTYIYEVFFPTLKSGMRTRGVLVVTSHNGVPVPQDELEKERRHAAREVEKAEEKISRATPVPSEPNSKSTPGMLPLGMYARTAVNREMLGRKHSAKLSVHTFLKTCALTLVRRQEIEGRETLIFNFTPRPGAQFEDNEKYIAQLTGEIWIDATDRIVTRLVGWPSDAPAIATSSVPASANKDQTASISPASERPPAVYVEMVRLPLQGIWLPRVTRLNGADYPTLFDGITADSTHVCSNFIRFSTEVKDVNVGAPNKP